MDCNLSRALIALGRRELTADDALVLDRHLAGCPACALAAQKLNALDSALNRAMNAVPIPPRLHDDLLKSAFARRGADLRRKIYQYAALAAAVLIAVGLSYGGYWRTRPVLNTNALAERVEAEQENHERVVRDWLAGQALPTHLPYEFDFRLCLFHGKGELHGRDVPVIVFASGRDTARVYLVRRNQFKTDDARFARSSLGSVEVLASADPTVLFVVTYTTERIDPFLLRRTVGQPG
jgi:hypothetical protein